MATDKIVPIDFKTASVAVKTQIIKDIQEFLDKSFPKDAYVAGHFLRDVKIPGDKNGYENIALDRVDFYFNSQEDIEKFVADNSAKFLNNVLLGYYNTPLVTCKFHLKSEWKYNFDIDNLRCCKEASETARQESVPLQLSVLEKRAMMMCGYFQRIKSVDDIGPLMELLDLGFTVTLPGEKTISGKFDSMSAAYDKFLELTKVEIVPVVSTTDKADKADKTDKVDKKKQIISLLEQLIVMLSEGK